MSLPFKRTPPRDAAGIQEAGQGINTRRQPTNPIKNLPAWTDDPTGVDGMQPINNHTSLATRNGTATASMERPMEPSSPAERPNLGIDICRLALAGNGKGCQPRRRRSRSLVLPGNREPQTVEAVPIQHTEMMRPRHDTTEVWPPARGTVTLGLVRRTKRACEKVGERRGLPPT